MPFSLTEFIQASVGLGLVVLAIGLGTSRIKLPSRGSSTQARVDLARDFGAAMAADDGAALRQLQSVGSRAGKRIPTAATTAPNARTVAQAAPSAPEPTPTEVTTILNGYLDRSELRPEIESARKILGEDTPDALIAVVVSMNSNRRLNEEDTRVRDGVMEYMTADPQARALEVSKAFQNLRAQNYDGPERETLKIIGRSLTAMAESRARTRYYEEHSRGTNEASGGAESR